VDTIKIVNPDYNLDTLRNSRIASVRSDLLWCLWVVELEALIKQQDQTLRAQATAQLRSSHFEDRRQSISSVHSLPPIQKTPPTEYNYASSCTHPGRLSRHNSTGRHDVTGLDHLADVAATSPPAADRRSPVSNPDIDPNLGYAAVSFPTFPHDIFTSHTQLVATPSRETEIQSPTVDESIGALLPFGSESVGLPPKEILDIMFYPLEIVLILGSICFFNMFIRRFRFCIRRRSFRLYYYLLHCDHKRLLYCVL
jgi:hypothetical protein